MRLITLRRKLSRMSSRSGCWAPVPMWHSTSATDPSDTERRLERPFSVSAVVTSSGVMSFVSWSTTANGTHGTITDGHFIHSVSLGKLGSL